MGWRFILTAICAALIGGWAGWSARAFLAVDACVDAGGVWEERGSYCYGARSAQG